LGKSAEKGKKGKKKVPTFENEKKKRVKRLLNLREK